MILSKQTTKQNHHLLTSLGMCSHKCFPESARERGCKRSPFLLSRGDDVVGATSFQYSVLTLRQFLLILLGIVFSHDNISQHPVRSRSRPMVMCFSFLKVRKQFCRVMRGKRTKDLDWKVKPISVRFWIWVLEGFSYFFKLFKILF